MTPQREDWLISLYVSRICDILNAAEDRLTPEEFAILESDVMKEILNARYILGVIDNECLKLALELTEFKKRREKREEHSKES